MTREEQINYLAEINQRCDEMILKKGDDYAGQADRMSNFKYSAQIAKISVMKHFLSLIATKVARLGELTQDGATPKYEGIDETLADLRNFSTLALSYLYHVQTSEKRPESGIDGQEFSAAR